MASAGPARTAPTDPRGRRPLIRENGAHGSRPGRTRVDRSRGTPAAIPESIDSARTIALTGCLAAGGFLGSCLVGPSYEPPSAPVPTAAAYREATRTAALWQIARPADAIPRGRWWAMFREPELDALQARLAIHNQSIAIAVQNYYVASAQVRAAKSQYFPTLNFVPSVVTGRESASFTGPLGTGGSVAGTVGTSAAGTGGTGTGALSTGARTGMLGTGANAAGAGAGTGTAVTSSVGRFTTFALPFEATWVPDLFGRVRSNVRLRKYSAQASAADLESTRLAVQSALASLYFQLRGQDALQDVLDATVAANEQIVDLTRSRYAHGIENESVVVQAELTLQNSRVQATSVGIARAQLEHAIATLLGVPATSFRMPRRALLPVPPRIPLGAPSRLLERRPDIAAAERTMASANAAIGVANAAYFPVVTLTGALGFASTTISSLFSWPSRVWSFGGTLVQAVFDAGLRRSQVDLTIATYNANVASYRLIVLTAFQQVEDALAQARLLAIEIEQQRTAVAFAQRAFDLEKQRYQAGLDPYVDLMLQQTALLAARQTLVQLQVQQMVVAVALVQALGGGWERTELPAPCEVGAPPPRGARGRTR